MTKTGTLVLTAAVTGFLAVFAHGDIRSDRTSAPGPLVDGRIGGQIRQSTNVAVNSLRSPATVTTPIYNSNGFEAPTFVPGTLIGQNGFVADVAASGVAQYQVIPSGGPAGQVVQALGGAAGTNWAYPPLNYTPSAGEVVSVNIDLARNVGATSAASSFGYAIDMYSNSTTALERIGRFGLTVNANNQIVAFVTSRFTAGAFNPAGPVANVIVSAPLAADTLYNFEAQLDFTAKNFDLLSGGAVIVDNAPFATLAAAGLGDADLQVSTNATATDRGLFDNYVVSAITVPEPTTLAALAGLGVIGARRRRA